MRLSVALFSGCVLASLFVSAPLSMRAQDAAGPGPQGGMRAQFAGAQRVAGEVVSVSGANITVKSEAGGTITVVTTTNTRLARGRGEALDLTTLKPGEGVIAMGQLDAPTKSLHAMMVIALTAEQTKQMQQAAAELKANLGKTYITGRVSAIDLDNLKMTVQRPDGQAQTIGFDEGTSFKKGGRVTGIGGGGGMMMFGGGGRRDGNGPANNGAPSIPGANTPAITGGESITLADISVGDNVVGLGSIKSGVFVPSTLNVQVRGEGGRRRGPDATGGGSVTPPQPAPKGPGF